MPPTVAFTKDAAETFVSRWYSSHRQVPRGQLVLCVLDSFGFYNQGTDQGPGLVPARDPRVLSVSLVVIDFGWSSLGFSWNVRV